MALYLNIIKKRVGGDDSVAVQKKRGGGCADSNGI
jgi:hypothetical protein